MPEDRIYKLESMSINQYCNIALTVVIGRILYNSDDRFINNITAGTTR